LWCPPPPPKKLNYFDFTQTDYKSHQICHKTIRFFQIPQLSVTIIVNLAAKKKFKKKQIHHDSPRLLSEKDWIQKNNSNRSSSCLVMWRYLLSKMVTFSLKCKVFENDEGNMHFFEVQKIVKNMKR